MNKLFVIGIFTLLIQRADAQFSKADLQATGLTCAMCSNAINKALQKVGFVESVESDIKNSSFAIVFKKDASVNIDALKEAVEDAGFSVGGLRLTGLFNEVKIAPDQHIKIGNSQFHFISVKDQVLNGEKTVTVVDKNFISEKQFKKYSSATKTDCIRTGKAGTCCTKEGLAEGERVFHVTI